MRILENQMEKELKNEILTTKNSTEMGITGITNIVVF